MNSNMELCAKRAFYTELNSALILGGYGGFQDNPENEEDDYKRGYLTATKKYLESFKKYFGVEGKHTDIGADKDLAKMSKLYQAEGYSKSDIEALDYISVRGFDYVLGRACWLISKAQEMSGLPERHENLRAIENALAEACLYLDQRISDIRSKIFAEY